jgi:hypothetical protein
VTTRSAGARRLGATVGARRLGATVGARRLGAAVHGWGGRARTGLSVPGRLRALTATAVALALALLGVLTLAVRDVHAGLDLIGHHSGPVVVSTSNLYFALADMDAQVANVLLVGDRTDLGVTRPRALELFDQRRRQVDGYLQQTAAYAGRDPAAGRDLRAVLDALGRYYALSAQAILVVSQAPGAPGRPPALALDLYRQATDVMHRDLLPAALRLTDDEAAQVEHEYAVARSTVGTAVFWVVVLGAALLLVLGAQQIFLIRHHRRVLSPALVAATLVTLGVLVTGLAAVTGANEQLRVAKEEAFDYAIDLHQARAVSYDANADRSRYLLDPERASVYETAFHAKSQQIVQTDAPGVNDYDAAVAAALAAYNADHRTVVFDGFLGRSLRHVKFSGERAADERTLATYQAYQAADRVMRALNRGGDLTEAIRFCTSFAPGGSNALFAAYDAALSELIALNERGFADAVTAGENLLSGWTLLPPLTLLAVAILVVVGAVPRLAEYRA